MSSKAFLTVGNRGILALGVVTFSIEAKAFVSKAKVMRKFSHEGIVMLMHAMGPNVAGVICCAVAAAM
ncbi:MAG: Na+-transporting methylmalonyl-CoA/oxaloacetate decarboxylase beta subunit [Alphaproteobacteria bacterium]